MLAQRTQYLIPTACHLCGDSAAHEIPNLCESCETRIPSLGHACELCQLPLNDERARCVNCVRQAPTYDSSVTLFQYKKPVDILFNRLKHHRDITVAATFATMLANKIIASGEPLPDIIIPIPLNWKRQLMRGFNQSQCIAMLLGGKLGVTVDTESLARVTNTAPQQGLSRSERLKNLDRCFHAEKSVRNKNVAIVDDVITTGATMDAAATALYIRGTKTIAAWSIARTPPEL